VIGDFQAPEHIKLNRPDPVLLEEVRVLLSYRTKYTILEWWGRFPVMKWWRYAIMASRCLARKVNYVYFLKCLLTAAYGGDRFDAYYQHLLRFFQAARQTGGAEAGERPVPPVCSCGGFCEKCYSAWTAYYGPLLGGGRALSAGLKPGMIGT